MNSYSGKSAGFIMTLIFSMFLGAAFSMPCSALEIFIRERVNINKDTICLGDIASFNPSDDSRVSFLKGVEISAAPRPNTSQRVNKELILYRLSPYLGSEKDIHLRIPENMFVHRKAQVLSSDAISGIFREHIINHSPWDAEDIYFERISAPENLALPVGRLDYEIEERLNNSYMGNISMTVRFMVDGKLERSINVSGRVSVSMDVVKSLRRISSGEIITAGDLTVVSERFIRFQGNVLTDMEDAVGKRAVRTIQADQNVIIGMIEDPPTVQRGDRVVIIADNGEIRITASGRVLEDGRNGDLVRVVNISSGTELYATVRRSNLVEVSF